MRWLFNNEPVTTPHFRIGSRPDGSYTLHIPEVFDEDAGRFSVLAENDAGKATCSALLVVVDESQILPRDESPPETPLKRAAPLGWGPPPVVPAKQVPVPSCLLHRVSKQKLCQCYFLNNSVKHWPI